MKLHRQDKISYLRPDWAGGAAIDAGFTTRNGGVSRQPYNSLNLGFNTDDPRHNVDGNRSTLTRAFGLESHQLLTVRQVHGNDLLLIDEPNPDLSHFLQVEADAVITNQVGMMIGVLVADCYPVLVHDPVHRVAAAIHVGWRGAAAGILAKSLKAMQAHFGSAAADLKVAVGPGIGAHKYEVDRPVRDAFRLGSGHWEACSREVALGKWQLDLRESCRLQLLDCGVSAGAIALAAECTCCAKELFYSHRRDAGKTGRQLGFILLR